MLGLITTIGLFAHFFGPAATVQEARGTVRVQQRIVIRVPRMSVIRAASASTPLPPIRWVERDAERCVPTKALAGATVTRADSVDLVLTGGRRLRAVLGNQCPTLDFYKGFYLQRTDDGMLCATRDSFRSRSGGDCPIEGFRALVPAR